MLNTGGETLVAVGRAIDGDTYVVSGLNVAAIVRLVGFDAPERSQSRGQECLRAIKPMVEGRNFWCAVRGLDPYGRILVQLWAEHGHGDLALVLLGDGLGWCVRSHAPDPARYMKAEAKARKDGKGLWQDPDPIAPWVWRRMMPHFRHDPMGAYHRRHRGA